MSTQPTSVPRMSPPMKYWFNIDNIHQTVGPIFRTMKWLGFLPFTLDASANALPLLRMRPSDAALLTGWQLYIGSMFFSGWIETVQELPMSKIMIYFSLLMYVAMSVLTSVIQLRLARSRAKIERLLRMIRFVDKLVRVAWRCWGTWVGETNLAREKNRLRFG